MKNKRSIAISVLLVIGFLLGPFTHCRSYQEFKDDRKRYGKISDIPWENEPPYLNITGKGIRGYLGKNTYRLYLRNHTLDWLVAQVEGSPINGTFEYYLVQIEFAEDFKFIISIDQVDFPIRTKNRLLLFDVSDDRYYSLQLFKGYPVPILNLIEFNTEKVISNRSFPISENTQNLFDSIRIEWFQTYQGYLYTIERYYLPENVGGDFTYSNIFSRLVKYDLKDLSQVDAVNLTIPYVRGAFIEKGILWLLYDYLPFEDIEYYNSRSQTITSGYYGYDLEGFFRNDTRIRSSVFRHHESIAIFPLMVIYDGQPVDFERHKLVRAEEYNIIPYSYGFPDSVEMLAGFVILRSVNRTLSHYINYFNLLQMAIGYSILIMFPFVLFWRGARFEPIPESGYLVETPEKKG